MRYADDFVMSYENTADARQMLENLKGRLAKFRLVFHEGPHSTKMAALLSTG